MKVVIVEDEARVASFLERGLAAEGFRVEVARTGPEGLALARDAAPDVVVLDVMLPGLNGREVCQRLRAGGSTVPILMLTALDSVEDRVEGLQLGADDYLTKPFAFEELVARLNALSRRARGFVAKPVLLQVGDLTFDREALVVRRRDREIALTAKELALLELLMSAPGKVFSRARILSNVWGVMADPLTNVVDVYVRRLRSKIESDGEPPLIHTLRGYGYKIGGTD